MQFYQKYKTTPHFPKPLNHKRHCFMIKKTINWARTLFLYAVQLVSIKKQISLL